MKLHQLTVLAGVSGCSLHTPESSAWEQITCPGGTKKHWNVKEYKPVLDPNTISADSEQYNAVMTALALMDKNPSGFRYTSGGLDNDDGVGLTNAESEIYFKDLTKNGAKPENATVIASEHIDPFASLGNCIPIWSDIQINTQYRLSRAPVGINKIQYILQTVKFSAFGLTVRPELVPQGLPLVVEGWTVNPFMVRQAQHLCPWV